jgi:hypothetical protein
LGFSAGIFAIFQVWSLSFGTAETQVSERQNNTFHGPHPSIVGKAISRVRMFEAWNSLFRPLDSPQTEEKSAHKLLQSLSSLSTKELREVMVTILRDNARMRPNYEYLFFVLNRFVFDVEGTGRNEAVNRNRISLKHVMPDAYPAVSVWPLAMQTDGQLGLVGIVPASTGIQPNALREFDEFKLHFPRRTFGHHQRKIGGPDLRYEPDILGVWK